jgi:hypothetical protein
MANSPRRYRLEEKLACPMEHASHERRFMTAQQGLSGSNFYDEHCSNVTRTINHLEGFFLDPNLMMQESIYSRPTTTVDTAGCVHYLSDLMWQPDDWTANATNLNPSPMLEADLKDPIDNAMTRAFSFVETQMLFEETRKRKKVLYRQKPDHIRVRKNIGTRNKAVSTRWRSEQLPSRGLCLPQLPDITKTQQLSSQPF